ncbi:MAG TPA: hypothetical protein VGK77_22830 [Candidatus Binatia bacterium]|jgi:hypothetical protein
MLDPFDKALVGEIRLLFEHGTAEMHFGARVFWLRRLAANGAPRLSDGIRRMRHAQASNPPGLKAGP